MPRSVFGSGGLAERLPFSEAGGGGGGTLLAVVGLALAVGVLARRRVRRRRESKSVLDDLGFGEKTEKMG